MAEDESAVAVGEREHPDKAPETTDKTNTAKPAEVSNLDIVRHYFDIAADRLGLARRPPRRLLDPVPRGHRPDPGQALRRQDPHLLRLPDPAQRRPRPLQGRHPLPPRGRRRRGPRARLADDLEDRGRRTSRSAAPRAASTARPSSSSAAELQKIARSFMDKIEKVLGPTRDIPAPDVNTNAQVMAWMMDEYGKLHGHTPAICHRQADRARGLLRARGGDRPRLRLHVPRGRAPARPQPGRDAPSSSRATATSAPGRPGSCSSSARRWSASPTPTARSAATAGIDANELHEHIAGGGKITEFEGAEAIDPDDLLAIPCDVFIPAALGGMIHEGNADRMQLPG